MPTTRQQLRDAVIAAIEANVDVLNRVTGLRTFARNEDVLPDCEVVTVSEEASRESGDGVRMSTHTIAIAIYDAVDAAGTVQDRLDAIAESVVEALDGDATIASLCDSFTALNFEFDFPDGGAEQPASLTINCVAMTLN